MVHSHGEGQVKVDSDPLFCVLDESEFDDRLPDAARAAVKALRSAEREYNRWAASVKRGERVGNIEETLMLVLDRDDEVIRTWGEFSATPSASSASAFADALEAACEVRLQFVRS